jgi:hypothetical protein
MDQPEDIHLEFWTTGVFPVMLFKAFIEKSTGPNSIHCRFVEDKPLPTALRRRTSAQLSIGISSLYYTDFILEGKVNTLYELLLKGLQPIYNILSNGDGKAMADWLKLEDNKYEFTYTGSEKLPLHFAFRSHWSEEEEKAAYEKMMQYIDRYEKKDEQVHEEIQRTPSDKDQIRFFSYDPGNGTWIIQDLLSEITLGISTDYLKYKKDNRVAKPDIMINEDSFNQHFVFDQQWVLDLDPYILDKLAFRIETFC